MMFTTPMIDKKTWLCIAGSAVLGSLLTLSVLAIAGPRFDGDRFEHGMRQEFLRNGEQGQQGQQGGRGERGGRGMGQGMGSGEQHKNCEMMNATGAIQQTGIAN